MWAGTGVSHISRSSFYVGVGFAIRTSASKR
jgi:hypothetical protein